MTRHGIFPSRDHRATVDWSTPSNLAASLDVRVYSCGSGVMGFAGVGAVMVTDPSYVKLAHLAKLAKTVG